MSKEVIKAKNEEQLLIVGREKFVSRRDGNEYWGYSICGVVRGREVKAHLVPPDNGGYAVLDLVFGDSDTAELVLVPYEIEDEKTKRVQRGFTYEVRNVDEDGEIYSCAIKPSKKSDKSVLDMLVTKANKAKAA